MIFLFSLLSVIFVSILITRIATIALTHTGLAREVARFQARSAFTGAGFTTSESEKIVNHPLRRKIVLLLMLLGNAGIVTAVTSLILTFVQQGGMVSTVSKAVILVCGVALLWALSASKWIDSRLSRIIDWGLKKYTELDVKDYASLMHLAGEYRLVEMNLAEDDWLDDKSLGEAKLRQEGIVVLGIQRTDGTYVGVPKAETRMFSGDSLLAYGRISDIAALDQRRKDYSGDIEHRQAVIRQKQESQKERREDVEREEKEKEAVEEAAEAKEEDPLATDDTYDPPAPSDPPDPADSDAASSDTEKASPPQDKA